jgi:hypothetical protein
MDDSDSVDYLLHIMTSNLDIRSENVVYQTMNVTSTLRIKNVIKIKEKIGLSHSKTVDSLVPLALYSLLSMLYLRER